MEVRGGKRETRKTKDEIEKKMLRNAEWWEELKDSSSCFSSGTSKIQLWLWWFHVITDKLLTPGLSVHLTSVGSALLVLESDCLCCSFQTEQASHRHTNMVKCVYMVLAQDRNSSIYQQTICQFTDFINSVFQRNSLLIGILMLNLWSEYFIKTLSWYKSAGWICSRSEKIQKYEQLLF